MAFKTAIQVTGLVRGEPDGKHRSNGKAVLGEMGFERISSSETLNRDLSSQNTYIGNSESGFAVWDDMERRAGEYKQAVKGKDKAGNEVTRYRGLRKNAVIGCAIIINPPYEECRNWTREDYDKFYEDSVEILHELKPEIFRDENREFRAIHVDEGMKTIPPQIYDEHMHEAYDCIDKDGHYCGNEIDAKFLADLNKAYPAKMRERGWDMEDLDVTDWEKYDSDAEYRSSRKNKAKKSGKSVNKHLHEIAKKDFEEANKIMMSIDKKSDKQYQVAVEQEVTKQEQERLQKQLEETAKQQAELQAKLDQRDKNQRKVINFIKQIIARLGGEIDQIQSYTGMMEALQSATDNFVADAEAKAEEKAENTFRERENALNEQAEKMIEQLQAIFKLREEYMDEMDAVNKDVQKKHRARTDDLDSQLSNVMNTAYGMGIDDIELPF